MIVYVHVGCTINHSSTVINPRRLVVACCFVWNLLVRTMRLRVAPGRSVTMAVFVPFFLSIMYTVTVIIVSIMSVLRRERAIPGLTHCV